MNKPVIMHILSKSYNEIFFSKPFSKNADIENFEVGQTIDDDITYRIEKVADTEKDLQLYVRETNTYR